MRQLELVQREKEAVAAAVAIQQQELQSMSRHMVKEEARWKAEQEELDKRDSALELM